MDTELQDAKRRLLLAQRRAGESPYVVVRGQSSGAHAGVMVSRDGREIHLENARRLWQWFGAATLSEVATKGVKSAQCKFGCPVSVEILDAIEVIYASEKGRKAIEAAPEWNPGA